MVHCVYSSAVDSRGSEVTDDVDIQGRRAPEAEEIEARAPKEWEGKSSLG